MLNKVLFWIFVWFLKTWKKSPTLFEMLKVWSYEVKIGCVLLNSDCFTVVQNKEI